MLKSRVAVASASSMFWPAVVLTIPMGLTFASVRVYAESGAISACTTASLAACADAAVQQACECGGGDCACTSLPCVDNGKTVPALACQPVVTCRSYALDECKGKTEGASCTQTASNGGAGPTGTCVTLAGGCYEKGDAGFYETARPLACNAPLNGADAGAANGGGGNGGSGCVVAPGAAGAGALFSAPLALGLLLMRRRRSRT